MKFLQGKYIPVNPQKYIGDHSNIVFRSSWERAFLHFVDTNPNVLRYASEEVVIPYVSPLDNKWHRYFVDFYVEIKHPDGQISRRIIEIKPFSQTQKPREAKRKTKRFQKELATFIVNKAKWEAAEKFAKERGLKFQILTEYDLGIKPLPKGKND